MRWPAPPAYQMPNMGPPVPMMGPHMGFMRGVRPIMEHANNARQHVRHADHRIQHENHMLFNEVSRLSDMLRFAELRVQEAEARFDMQQQQDAARKAANASEPPTFPHLFPNTISDHLILTSVMKGDGGDGSTSAAERGEASLRACTRPHLGVSLSLSDLSYKPAVPGEVQELELKVTNDSLYPIILRDVRFVGPVPEPPPFSCARGAPHPEHGTIVPAAKSHTLAIRCVAPEERGLSRQWCFVMVEATEADSRTVRICHFALAAALVLYTFHSESITVLSPEAHPFFPSEWRNLWEMVPALLLEPPPPSFPELERRLELSPPPRVEKSDPTTIWEVRF